MDFSRTGEEDVVEPRARQLEVALHHLRRWCRQQRSPPKTILKPGPPGPAQALKPSSESRRPYILGLSKSTTASRKSVLPSQETKPYVLNSLDCSENGPHVTVTNNGSIMKTICGEF